METLNYHSKPNFAVGLYHRLVCCENNLQSAVLLALRLTWGWQLAESGYRHLTHIDTTVQAFIGWGVPFPKFNVYLSGSMELIGGSLLVLGLATRLISIPLVFNFIVAYLSASRDTLHELFTGKHLDGTWGGRLDGYDNFINDNAFPMLMLALTMLAFGPGKASIDYLLQRTVLRRREQAGGFTASS
jgi:putative oxidoreductase